MCAFGIGEVVHCQVGVRCVAGELSGDPFQGASSFVVFCTKDAVVPVAEVVLLLVENV